MEEDNSKGRKKKDKRTKVGLRRGGEGREQRNARRFGEEGEKGKDKKTVEIYNFKNGSLDCRRFEGVEASNEGELEVR